MSKIELIQGDCLEKMKDIPDGSVDLVVTSPPYFLNKEYEKTISYEDYCLMMKKSFVEWSNMPGMVKTRISGYYFAPAGGYGFGQ